MLAPFGMLALAVGLRLAQPQLVQEARLKVFDSFNRLHPRPYEAAPVRVVDLDDESLTRVGQWPWPRTVVARMVERLGELGAAVVAFDVVFAEPDRTSPELVLPSWPETPEVRKARELLRSLPSHDDVLAQAFRGMRVVTGFVLTAEPGGRAPEPKAGFSWGGDDPSVFLPAFPGTVLNLPQLEQAASGNGSFAITADVDGLYRRAPLLFRHEGKLLPSLAAEALRLAVGGNTFLVKSAGASGELAFGEQTGITHVRIPPAFTIPTDSQGRVWLHFTEPRPERYVPAWQVMEGSADPALLEGHIVFVGTSAAGLKDLRPTPVDPVAPGVVVHAELAEQVLLDHFLSRPDWADGAEVVYLTALGLLLIVLLPRAGAFWSAPVGLGAVGLVIGLSWYAYVNWRWLLDPVYPSFAILLVYLAGSAVGFLRSEVARRQVRGAFAHYLAPALVEELSRNPEKLQLGGEMREMTLLFSDIRGFTTISEQLEPTQLTHLMNRFLTPMTQVILERRGTIDKYMGDCIMAFWNAPLDDPGHPLHACEAALAMVDALAELNERLQKEAEEQGRKQPPIRIGIGLNTGACCVGNMGSDQRFDYSVISDEVNLASRLEGQSKNYGVTIVIGENTQVRVERTFATLELDLIRVKGKTRPVRIHTLLGGRERRVDPQFLQLVAKQGEMLKAYRGQEWTRAAELLEECRGLEPGLAGLWELYAERIEECRAHPPGPDWDGVYTATTK
jgi:adenylate cyclase